MRRIALVDFITGGHHLAFMRLFTKALVELGNEVWVFYPEEQKIKNWTSSNVKSQSSVHFISINIDQQKFTSFGRFNDMLSSIKLWSGVQRAIKREETRQGEKVDFVFLAWLDSFLACNFPIFIHRLVFKYEWSGLYFHPYHLRLQPESLGKKTRLNSIDYILTSKRCKSVAIHDRTVADSFSKNRLSGKKVVVLPETADDSPADPTNKLALEIKEKAKGRTIIGVIGITGYKGLYTMIKLARIANPNQFFFVTIGQLNISHYPSEQHHEVLKFLHQPTENQFVYLDRLNEGKEFNSVFLTIDIPFLVYNNFMSTSNNLTKAVQMGKKVVVSKGFCIGEDVEKYQLGVTIRQGDEGQALQAIKVLKGSLKLSASEKKLFEKYVRLNSTQELKLKLKKLLAVS